MQEARTNPRHTGWMTDAPPTQTPAQLRRFGFILLANAAFLTVVIVGAALLSGRYLLFILLLAVVANVYFASRQFAQARGLSKVE